MLSLCSRVLVVLSPSPGFPNRFFSATVPDYAGHNKVRTRPSPVSRSLFTSGLLQWSKIQQKKGINDQRRGQAYARAFRVSIRPFFFFLLMPNRPD